jgi:shikimate kinase
MRERGRALVLIGFMGTGKSSAGRAIAQQLRLPRFDTDELVSKRFGLAISDIFKQLGEPAFRDAETEVLRELDGGSEAVIVTGGGIVLRDQNVEQLRRLGTIVNLTAREAIVFDRISRRPSRPLLETLDPRLTISDLIRTREPLYAAAADVHVDTSDLTHEEVARAVVEQWEAAITTAAARP